MYVIFYNVVFPKCINTFYIFTVTNFFAKSHLNNLLSYNERSYPGSATTGSKCNFYTSNVGCKLFLKCLIRNSLEHWSVLARIHCISLRLSTAVTSTGYWLPSELTELIWHLWMTLLGCRNTLSSYCCSWWIWPMTLCTLYFWIYTVTFQLPAVCCLKKTPFK